MKRFIVLVLIIFLILLTGCSNTKSTIEDKVLESSDTVTDNNKDIDKDNTNKEIKEEIEIVDSNEETIENEISQNPYEGKVKSPFTGLYVEKERINKRPIAVMIDNYYRARPQSGLSSADVVYEILAEGNITRYLAIINTDKPELIGPVRSARPYFIAKALEYDPFYIHVGGSPQAFADISSLKIADIDALSAGRNIFWRKNHKPIPNNMYTNYKAIVKESNRRKYRQEGKYETIGFNDEDKEIMGEELNAIKFPYKKGYTSEFRYNKEKGIYDRYINKKPHRDETTDLQISAENIIVQYAPIRVIDNKGRLEIDIIGQGRGLYITNGKMMEIKWRKKSHIDLTRLFDSNGEEIKLNPGVTWYQVVPNDMKVIKR